MNGFGYLQTDMKAKLQSLKKLELIKSKAKTEKEYKKADKDYRELIMEMEWLRMKKMKKVLTL